MQSKYLLYVFMIDEYNFSRNKQSYQKELWNHNFQKLTKHDHPSSEDMQQNH
jgi:hypothetical protein